MKKFKGLLIIMLVALFIFSGVGGGAVFAADAQEIDINVDQDDLLDIVLTLGNTDSDVSTLETDLTNALVAKGVPEDKIMIQAVESSDVSAGDTTAGWEVFDHTNYPEDEIAYYKPYYNEVNGNFYLHDHIVVSTTDGTDIDFYGYGAPSYKDFMYMPNSDPGKKIIDFYIEEGEFYDAIDGPGFLLNTSMSDDAFPAKTMTGYMLFFKYTTMSSNPPVIYLYSFSNVNVYNFHGSTSGVVSSVANIGTLVATASVSPLNSNVGTIRKVKIEATPTGMQMWYADAASGDPDSLTLNQVTWNLAAGGSSTEVTLSDTGSYGFGPLNSYLSHGCNRPTHFVFNDITMSTESSKQFSEVIREPEWRDESKRFIINAEDGAVSDFSDPEALGEILARLGNENIHYLGWGYDDADGEAFIAKNDGNGIYIDKDDAATDTYSEQINALAQYIYDEYVDGVVNDTEYLLYGKPSSLSITPETEQTNTADEDWPNGKWYIDHDETYYENSTGVAPYDEMYLSNLDISFIETGKYDIYYKDEIVKTVYVHRQPVAKFSVIVDGSYGVEIDDQAYDPDTYDPGNGANDEGIKSTEWYYKETTAASWTSGQPTTFQADKEYIIKQVVTDNYDVESDPYIRYVSTSTGGDPSTPVAEFKVTPSPLRTYITQTVSYTDTSYDPNGESTPNKLWKISLDGVEKYSGSSQMTDFSNATTYPAGTYKITLEVQNDSGIWSEPVARYLTVIRDTTDPTATCDLASGSYNEPKVITLTFSDEEGGSGFSYRYAVLTDSATEPTEWGSMGTNSTYSIAVNSLGTYYLHYKAADYAGNESDPAYFGPFTFADNSPPSTPTIEVTPAYSDGTWSTVALTVTASGSTDDFTADEDLLYKVSTDNTTYTNGNSASFDTTGTFTAYFKVEDASGNISTIATKTVKIDVDDPTDPIITMVSNSLPYTEDTWATQDIDITLSGATDVGSGVGTYQYKIDDGEWQDGSTYTFSTSGEYTFYYRAKDVAGNVSETLSKSVKLDKDPPNVFTIDTSITTINSIDISASTTDDDSGMATLAYRVYNGTEWSDWKATMDETLTGYTRGQSVTIKVEAIDMVGNVRGSEITVSTLDNTEPTANDDAFTMKEDAAETTLAVKTNDTDADTDTADGDNLTVIEVSELSDPAAGILKLTAGTVTFEPAADYNGEVTFTYIVEDDFSAQDTATVTITVTAVNDKPIAVNDSASVKEDSTVLIDVLQNDDDIDSTLSIKTFSYPVNGSVIKSGSGLKYTPDKDFYGKDVFTYTVTDGTYESSAIVTVTVTSVNDAPELNDDSANAIYETSVEIDVLANDSDIESTVLTLSSVSTPQNGNAVISAGKIIYTPADDFTGTDTFTYTVADGSINATATVTVEVSYPAGFKETTVIFNPTDGGGDDGDDGEGDDGDDGGDGGDGGHNHYKTSYKRKS